MILLEVAKKRIGNMGLHGTAHFKFADSMVNRDATQIEIAYHAIWGKLPRRSTDIGGNDLKAATLILLGMVFSSQTQPSFYSFPALCV